MYNHKQKKVRVRRRIANDVILMFDAQVRSQKRGLKRPLKLFWSPLPTFCIALP